MRLNQSLHGERDKGLHSDCLQELSLSPQSRESRGECHQVRKQEVWHDNRQQNLRRLQSKLNVGKVETPRGEGAEGRSKPKSREVTPQRGRSALGLEVPGMCEGE